MGEQYNIYATYNINYNFYTNEIAYFDKSGLNTQITDNIFEYEANFDISSISILVFTMTSFLDTDVLSASVMDENNNIISGNSQLIKTNPMCLEVKYIFNNILSLGSKIRLSISSISMSNTYFPVINATIRTNPPYLKK